MERLVAILLLVYVVAMGVLGCTPLWMKSHTQIWDTLDYSSQSNPLVTPEEENGLGGS